jgi:hypothetical protein
VSWASGPMAPWPHVEFKASRSLRIQWPFNCCNISLLSWHWSILIFPEIQCSQGHGDPFTGEAASLSSMSILEVLLKPKWVVFERCWKCISIILSMYWFVYSNIRYTYVYIYIVVWIYLYWCIDCIVAKAKRHTTTQPQFLPTESVPESSTQPQGDEIKPRTEWKM